MAFVFKKIWFWFLAVTNLQKFQKIFALHMSNHMFLIFCVYPISNPNIWLLHAHLLVLSQPSLYEYLVSISPTVTCQTAGLQEQKV